MNPREVAMWLNIGCTEEEFLETFALLYKALDGRGIPEEYDKEFMIESLDIDVLCRKLGAILETYKKEITREE